MAGSGIESTILKEGPLELYDRGSWVHRHAEICTRSHKHGMDVDKQFLVHRLKPARRELGHVELKSALLSAGDRPDAGERPLAPPCPPPPPRSRTDTRAPAGQTGASAGRSTARRASRSRGQRGARSRAASG